MFPLHVHLLLLFVAGTYHFINKTHVSAEIALEEAVHPSTVGTRLINGTLIYQTTPTINHLINDTLEYATQMTPDNNLVYHNIESVKPTTEVIINTNESVTPTIEGNSQMVPVTVSERPAQDLVHIKNNVTAVNTTETNLTFWEHGRNAFVQFKSLVIIYYINICLCVLFAMVLPGKIAQLKRAIKLNRELSGIHHAQVRQPVLRDDATIVISS